MGLLARVKGWVNRVIGSDNVSNVTVDPGGGNIITPLHASNPGDDSRPLDDDITVAVHTQKSGDTAAVGYIDHKNASVANPGEKKIYSRDSDGNITGWVYLKNDGEIEISNTAGASIVLMTDGTVEINGQAFGSHTHEAGTYEAGGDPVTGESGGVV